ADRLYERRESPERAREALALLRRALAADYKSYEAAWKLARAGFYVGTHGGGEEKARLEAFREGIAAGEVAVRIEPNRPEGHFWLGACIGGRAKLQGPLYALSSAGDIRREMEEVIKLDEGFQAGSAYLALGQLDLELPEILGGDDARALQNLEKGLQFGQNNALLRLRLAEAYFRLKRHAEARAQARAILEMKPSPGYEPEYKQAAEGAKRLLEKIK
ncbi:MAG TPA: TRAP transporter TatT component family protein, partial [Pyrinomonadaceae bacterium]|nr:TRAP transporter TatT component family protein [Pyrinomonadaceae bacterium]